jgi:hypothetical protein
VIFTVKKILMIPVLAIAMTVILLAISVKSEADWQSKSYDIALRETIGLPSIAIGTNYEGTRNPLVEVFVRALYDVPGGHDYVVSSSFIDTPMWQGFYRSITPGFNMTMIRG